MVRAKFKVNSKQPYNTGGRVTLNPVYSPDPNHENKAFWDATPSGTINLHINNQQAYDRFEQDTEYFIDFTPAD